MLTIIIRSVLIYIIVIFVFRLMGKRQLGQMQPFELVLTLIIADLATIPMAEISIPFLHGVVPLLTLVIVHFLITIIVRSSVTISKIVNGKPAIVITPNGIDYKILKNLNLSVDDLFEAIRGCNYFSFDQIGYAIVETTGQVNVIPKPQYAPLTLGDYNKDSDILKTIIPVTLVSEGTFLEENAKIANTNIEFVKKIMKEQNTKKIKDILILTIDKNGSIFYQEKNGKAVSISMKSEKEINI